MKWMKFFMLLLVLIVGIYAGSMALVEEKHTFVVEKEVNYPIEKVYPQFSNLQNLTKWHTYFQGMSTAFFFPYEGENAGLRFVRNGSMEAGEVFIRYENPYKGLRYHLYEPSEKQPYHVNVRFYALSPEKTKLVWEVHTPNREWFEHSMNLWEENEFVGHLDKSLQMLHLVLGNKVDRTQFLSSVKYDSLIIEDFENEVLLGVNVTTANKGDHLWKNIVLNHNKVYNFVTMDLAKQEDEFGFPVLITDPRNFKDKEVSYFYGIPVSGKQQVTDNNFSYREEPSSRRYVIYYKGNYDKRAVAVQTLVQKAKKDSMKYRSVHQIFLSEPKPDQLVNIKFSLPVYR